MICQGKWFDCCFTQEFQNPEALEIIPCHVYLSESTKIEKISRALIQTIILLMDSPCYKYFFEVWPAATVFDYFVFAFNDNIVILQNDRPEGETI